MNNTIFFIIVVSQLMSLAAGELGSEPHINVREVVPGGFPKDITWTTLIKSRIEMKSPLVVAMSDWGGPTDAFVDYWVQEGRRNGLDSSRRLMEDLSQGKAEYIDNPEGLQEALEQECRELEADLKKETSDYFLLLNLENTLKEPPAFEWHSLREVHKISSNAASFLSNYRLSLLEEGEAFRPKLLYDWGLVLAEVDGQESNAIELLKPAAVALELGSYEHARSYLNLACLDPDSAGTYLKYAVEQPDLYPIPRRQVVRARARWLIHNERYDEAELFAQEVDEKEADRIRKKITKKKAAAKSRAPEDDSAAVVVQLDEGLEFLEAVTDYSKVERSLRQAIASTKDDTVRQCSEWIISAMLARDDIQAGTQADYARAAKILEEQCGSDDEEVQTWSRMRLGELLTSGKVITARPTDYVRAAQSLRTVSTSSEQQEIRDHAEYLIATMLIRGQLSEGAVEEYARAEKLLEERCVSRDIGIQAWGQSRLAEMLAIGKIGNNTSEDYARAERLLRQVLVSSIPGPLQGVSHRLLAEMLILGQVRQGTAEDYEVAERVLEEQCNRQIGGLQAWMRLRLAQMLFTGEIGSGSSGDYVRAERLFRQVIASSATGLRMDAQSGLAEMLANLKLGDDTEKNERNVRELLDEAIAGDDRYAGDARLILEQHGASEGALAGYKKVIKLLKKNKVSNFKSGFWKVRVQAELTQRRKELEFAQAL